MLVPFEVEISAFKVSSPVRRPPSTLNHQRLQVKIIELLIVLINGDVSGLTQGA